MSEKDDKQIATVCRMMLEDESSSLEDIKEACEGLAMMYEMSGPAASENASAARAVSKGLGRNSDVQERLTSSCGQVGRLAAEALVRLEGPVFRIGEDKYRALREGETISGEWSTDSFGWVKVGDVHSCSWVDTNFDTMEQEYGPIISVSVDRIEAEGEYSVYTLTMTKDSDADCDESTESLKPKASIKDGEDHGIDADGQSVTEAEREPSDVEVSSNDKNIKVILSFLEDTFKLVKASLGESDTHRHIELFMAALEEIEKAQDVYDETLDGHDACSLTLGAIKFAKAATYSMVVQWSRRLKGYEVKERERVYFSEFGLSPVAEYRTMAISLFKEAIELKVKADYAWFNIGQLLAHEDIDGAENAFRKAIELTKVEDVEISSRKEIANLNRVRKKVADQAQEQLQREQEEERLLPEKKRQTEEARKQREDFLKGHAKKWARGGFLIGVLLDVFLGARALEKATVGDFVFLVVLAAILGGLGAAIGWWSGGGKELYALNPSRFNQTTVLDLAIRYRKWFLAVVVLLPVLLIVSPWKTCGSKGGQISCKEMCNDHALQCHKATSPFDPDQRRLQQAECDKDQNECLEMCSTRGD